MSLDTSLWKPFVLGSLFDIKKGKRLTSADQTEGDIPYIGAIDSNNGVSNYIGQSAIHDGNTISLSYNGSVGEAFYQTKPFWATDDVNVLYFREENHHEFSQYIGLFMCGILRQEKYRFSYGRKWTLENMNKTVVYLPVTDDGSPDWDFMESYMKMLHYKPLTTANKKENIVPLHPEMWKKFRVGDLFECETTSAVLSDNMIEGNIPYITRSGENNGNSGTLGNLDKVVHGNCITIGAEGAIAFYQPDDFIPGVKVYTIRHPNLNRRNAMFIVGILNTEYYKYSYGRARILDKLKNENIMLPIQANGTPDWNYMEGYIKSLPYGDRL